MKTYNKKPYSSPTLKVFEFRVEGGYALSTMLLPLKPQNNTSYEEYSEWNDNWAWEEDELNTFLSNDSYF